MTYQQYLSPNALDVIGHTLYAGVFVGLPIVVITAIVCLIRRSQNKKKALVIAAVIGASLGMPSGFQEGIATVDAPNLSILNANLSQKYEVQSVSLGNRDVRPKNQVIKELPTMKDPQNVWVLTTWGQNENFTLVQDKITNEPTLINLKTQSPETFFLRSNNQR